MAEPTIAELATSSSSWATGDEWGNASAPKEEEVKEQADVLALQSAGLLDGSGTTTAFGAEILRKVEATDDPERYLDLFLKGLIGPDLRNTPRGDLFAGGQESILRYGDEKDWRDWNRWGFREEEGVKAPEVSFGDMVSGLVDSVWNAAKFSARLTRPAMMAGADDALVMGEYARESMRAPVFLSEGTKKVFNEWVGTSATAQGAEFRYLKAQQQLDDLTTAEAIVTGVASLPIVGPAIVSDEMMQAAVATPDAVFQRGLSPEQVEEARAIGRGGGELLNPFDAASNVLTGMAASSLKLGATTPGKLIAQQRRLAALEARRAALEATKEAAAGVLPRNGMSRAERVSLLRQVDGQLEKIGQEAAETQKVIATLEERMSASGIAKAGDRMRQLAASPATAGGAVAERVGKAVETAARRLGLDGTAGNIALVTGAAVAGSMGLPVPAILAAGAALGTKGRALQQLGNAWRVMGAEFVKRRGTLPYWRRVAAQAADNPLLRGVGALETVAPAVKVPGKLAAAAAKGTLAEVPFNYLASGGEGDWLKESAAEALVFGVGGKVFGSIGHLSGVPAKANLEDFAAMRVADAHELRRTLLDSDKANFDAMDANARMAAGVYAAHAPDILWRFIKTEKGTGGSYDPAAGVITVDVASKYAMKDLMAHEVAHSLTTRGIKDSLVDILIGERGYLRGKDGDLKPEAKRARKKYEAAKQQPITDEEFAMEWIAEALTPGISRGVDNGALQQAVQRNPYAREVVERIVDKFQWTEGFLRKAGVLFDERGLPVKGRGNLDFGASLPKSVMQQLEGVIQAAAGVQRSTFDATRTKLGKVDVYDPQNKSIVDEMGAQYKLDKDGYVIRDSNGLPVPEDIETLRGRESAGLLVKEMLDGMGVIPQSGKPPVYVLDPESARKVYNKVAAQGHFNANQLAALRMALDAIADGEGRKFHGSYQQVYKRKGKNGRVVPPEGVEVEWRVDVPYGISFSKEGNILIRVYQPEKLLANIAKAANSKLGRDLYGGDKGAIYRDVMKMVQNQKETLSRPELRETINKEAFPRTNQLAFLNAIFGDLGTEHKASNPLVTAGMPKMQVAVTSRRLDRLNRLTDTGEASLPARMDMLQKMLLPEKNEGGPRSPRHHPGLAKDLAGGLDKWNRSDIDSRQAGESPNSVFRDTPDPPAGTEPQSENLPSEKRARHLYIEATKAGFKLPPSAGLIPTVELRQFSPDESYLSGIIWRLEGASPHASAHPWDFGEGQAIILQWQALNAPGREVSVRAAGALAALSKAVAEPAAYYDPFSALLRGNWEGLGTMVPNKVRQQYSETIAEGRQRIVMTLASNLGRGRLTRMQELWAIGNPQSLDPEAGGEFGDAVFAAALADASSELMYDPKRFESIYAETVQMSHLAKKQQWIDDQREREGIPGEMDFFFGGAAATPEQQVRLQEIKREADRHFGQSSPV